MRIYFGSKRIVLLWGKDVFKIGRIRWIRLIFRHIVGFIFSSRRRELFLEKYGPTFWEAIWKYLTVGYRANQNESDYFRTHYEDFRIMPISRKLFGGWIIVQPRGDKVSAEELRSVYPFKDCEPVVPHAEISSPEKFVRHRGSILLVTYEREATRDALHLLWKKERSDEVKNNIVRFERKLA